MKALVTGAAGFIGMHTARRLLDTGYEVVGLDNLNSYYEVSLKQARLERLASSPGFRFERIDIADRAALSGFFERHRPECVVHLAAQAGVRHSIDNPNAYVESNLVGFCNILEACRQSGIAHLVYASSSSVYGANSKLPFSVEDRADHPVSLYAATKRSNELLAHAYSHIFQLPATGLRFFTVYGPWGRPDMAPFLFTRAILERRPIKVFNYGRMMRDFTYIDDIVEGVTRVLGRIPAGQPPYKLYNIGNHEPVQLTDFIGTLESCLGMEAQVELLPMQPGDVPATFADVTELCRDAGFQPSTPLRDGLSRFVEWYRAYYRI